jgi:hypothetical protein
MAINIGGYEDVIVLEILAIGERCLDIWDSCCKQQI